MASAPSSTSINTHALAANIRHWVHYNGVLDELHKQVKAARETRNAYEQQILSSLKSSSLQNPVIQVGGGRLIVAQERQQQGLSMKTIEDLLHGYYAQKLGARDETSEIMNYIRTHRNSSTHDVLRYQRERQTRAKDVETSSS